MSTLSIAEQSGVLFVVFAVCLCSIVGIGMLLFGNTPQCVINGFCCLVARVVCKKCCGFRCGYCNKLRKKLEEEDKEDEKEEEMG